MLILFLRFIFNVVAVSVVLYVLFVHFIFCTMFMQYNNMNHFLFLRRKV